MQVIFSDFERSELEDAISFFELASSGLGQVFKQEIKTSIARIVNYPDAWSIERGDVRKCLLHKFPYKILYSIEPDHIFIIAIAHQHRKPDYWVEN